MSTAAASTPIPANAPAWAAAMRRFTNYLVNDFGGGPRPWKLAWVINFQKAGTFPFLGLLIAWYHNTSTAARIYLAMHGSYGLVWIIKDLAFPDPSWQHRITIGGGINAFLGVLGWYWVFGWLLISGVSQPAYPLPDYAWFCLCISLCILGCVIMIAADAQKYFTLRVQRGLITDGMHRYIRHPNYLGEMMIYGSFALMVWHWLPVVVLAWVWGGLFAVNMTLKEASLSRYPEWAQYKQRSWWLLPLVLQEGAVRGLVLGRSRSQRRLIPEFLWHGPESQGFRGEIWTYARVAKVIEEEFGVAYHKGHIARLLKELHWTPQVPVGA